MSKKKRKTIGMPRKIHLRVTRHGKTTDARRERYLKRNRYTCQKCGEHIITVDLEYGTTPMFLHCHATPDCDGQMASAMYRVDQALQPDYEWYKPAKLPRNPAMRDHVERGGLMLRPAEKDNYPAWTGE